VSRNKAMNRVLMSAVALAAFESIVTRPMASYFYNDQPKPQPRTPWQTDAEKIAKAKAKRERRSK